MKLPVTFQRLFSDKKYIVKALGWSQTEIEQLDAELNGTKQFVVVNKDIDIHEVEWR